MGRKQFDTMATTNAANIAQDNDDERQERRQHQHFIMQSCFSAIGMVFSAVMLLVGKEPSIYLPIFTSILFSWLPSPMSSNSGVAALKRLSDLGNMLASQRSTRQSGAGEDQRIIDDLDPPRRAPTVMYNNIRQNPSFIHHETIAPISTSNIV